MAFSHPDSSSLDDETEAYTPLKHTRLVVSDDGQFLEVSTRPSSPSFNIFDTEMGLTSASSLATASTPTHTLQNPAMTTSSTAPAAVAAKPSNPASPFLPPSSPSPPPSTLTDGQQSAMSQADARAVIKAYILAAAWFRAHEMEPRVDGEGVPWCARLLASPKDSIWACFYRRVLRNGVTIFKCAEAGCPHQTPRLDRAEDHQRSKSRHKPFACTDSGCEFRGSTRGSVVDHRSTRTGKIPCEICGEAVVGKNMRRHLLRHGH